MYLYLERVLKIASRQIKKPFDHFERLSVYFVINNINSNKKRKRIDSVACVYYYHSGDGARQTAPVSMTLMTVEYLDMYFFIGGGQQKIQNPRNFLS